MIFYIIFKTIITILPKKENLKIILMLKGYLVFQIISINFPKHNQNFLYPFQLSIKVQKVVLVSFYILNQNLFLKKIHAI